MLYTSLFSFESPDYQLTSNIRRCETKPIVKKYFISIIIYKKSHTALQKYSVNTLQVSSDISALHRQLYPKNKPHIDLIRG